MANTPVFIKVATTAIVQHEGKIFIGKRTKDGLWEFPGGKIDPGETPAQCIVREIKEELNIDVRIDKTFEKISGIFRGIQMELYPFVTTWTGGEIKNHVHADIKWITPREAGNFDFVEEDMLILRQEYKIIL